LAKLKNGGQPVSFNSQKVMQWTEIFHCEWMIEDFKQSVRLNSGFPIMKKSLM